MIMYLKSLKQMTIDIFSNLKRIFYLALFEYKVETKDMFLGGIWKILSPFVQIGVYWLVFGIGLRSGKPIDGIPYVVWLTCGLTPWYIMNMAISRSSNSIYMKAILLTRANIPTCIIPISSVTSVIFDNCWTILLMFIMYLANGCIPTVMALGLIYYFLCMIAFLVSISFILSSLVMLARDFNKIIQIIMRLMFFISPVFWKPGQTLPKIFIIFNKLNPFAYIINGFRDSLLYNVSIFESMDNMIGFWIITILCFLMGALFQDKMRKNLLDYL